MIFSFQYDVIIFYTFHFPSLLSLFSLFIFSFLDGENGQEMDWWLIIDMENFAI